MADMFVRVRGNFGIEVTTLQVMLSGLFTLGMVLNLLSDPSFSTVHQVEIFAWIVMDLLYLAEIRHGYDDIPGMFGQIFFLCYMSWLLGRHF